MSNPDAPEGLAYRLRLALHGESVSAFARKCDMPESLLRKYLAGSEPGVSRLVRIARAAGVRLEWLATGEGPMRAGEVAAVPVPAPAEPPPLLDEELLEIVLAAVEDGLGEAGLELPPVKKARLVTILYEDLLKEERGRDAAAVRGRVLRLVRLAG